MLALKAEKREIVGKKVGTLRKKGFLPAVVYGPKVKALSLVVEKSHFATILKKAGESTVVDLHIEENGKDHTYGVLIHDVVKDALTGQLKHVDFYAVDMAKTVKAEIPLHFTGESPAVKELGGILIKILHEVEVEALPMDLPHEFTIDISGLKNLEDKIKIAHIPHGQKVKILADANETIALVEPPRSEVEVSSLAEVKTEAEAIESIKVVSEEKKKTKEVEVPEEDKKA